MTKPSPRSETPFAFVEAIVLAYRKRGMNPAPALNHAGISGDLRAGPGQRVGIDAFEDLSAYAMRELDDEALGWFSRRLPWGSYGMMLRASLPSRDLGVAVGRWCRHHNLLTEDVRIELHVESGTATLRIHEETDLGPLREFALVSLMRNFHGITCWLADSRIGVDRVEFPFPAPLHASAYGRMFPGEIGFDAETAAIHFDAAYLRLPVVRDDDALRQILRRPIPLMARHYGQDRLLSHRIRQLLRSGEVKDDAGAIATALGVSLRSLQRHLRDEGTSLLELKAQGRREAAEDLLGRPDLPIKRVAHLVGYDNESSFSRAFRGWTGKTPADFRRAITAERVKS